MDLYQMYRVILSSFAEFVNNSLRNSSETDDSITGYIFKRSTAFSQCHIFFLGISNFKNGVYCQQCGYVIWISLQSSQFCTACGFGVHYTCMDNIMRTCVALKVKSQPDFIMDICPERILPQLKYR